MDEARRVVVIPSFGFGRGAVVRLSTGGENMLVVRQLETTTACIVCEGDTGGTLRLREFATDDLTQILAPQGLYGKQRETPTINPAPDFASRR